MDKAHKCNPAAFELINTVDALNTCTSLLNGATNMFWSAMDALPTPKDRGTLDRVNDYQVSAMALVDIIRTTLNTASACIVKHARGIDKEAN